ncbi:MAG: NAD(P)/FAD-dependent oxidoreductase [Thaumarchaeota archaeon]|nr:NAD(P)/FAD-dependent oxidoreductase [Nitrososphaerota archaeon]
MPRDYDVIVAGGGMTGLITATTIAKYTNQTMKILVIDRNEEINPARKNISGWTCGDAVSKRSIDFYSKEVGITYDYPELEHKVKGVIAFAPDRKTKVSFDGEGYVLNRKLLGLRQVEDAKKLGVEFSFETESDKLVLENGFITGVEILDKDKQRKTLTAKIVVDATGSASKLRQNLPIENSFMEKQIDRENDMETTGRYILEFDRGETDTSLFDDDYCIIHLNQDIAPGGYAWVFPKSKNKVNIGLGVQKKRLVTRNQRLGKNDTLQSLIDDYISSNTSIKNYRLSSDDADSGNSRGNWQVPVRRQNDCMVENGYVIVGDAAWLPRPIDAGGIGPGIFASVIAGKTIANALQAKDYSQSSLWNYNTEYVRNYGYQMASFEILRRFLQIVLNEKISYGMKHFLSADDVEKIVSREHPSFDKVNMFNPLMLFKILTHWSLAKELRYTAKKSNELVRHSQAYPESPESFPEWKNKLDLLLSDAYSRFS